MSTTKQPESRIVDKIIKTLNSLEGCYAEKNHGGPYGKCKLDITGGLNGKLFHIEVKVPGKHPTPRQLAAMRQWEKKAHAITGCATSVEEALEIIKPLQEQT